MTKTKILQLMDSKDKLLAMRQGYYNMYKDACIRARYIYEKYIREKKPLKAREKEIKERLHEEIGRLTDKYIIKARAIDYKLKKIDEKIQKIRMI